jgi:hypothetical protein
METAKGDLAMTRRMAAYGPSAESRRTWIWTFPSSVNEPRLAFREFSVE